MCLGSQPRGCFWMAALAALRLGGWGHLLCRKILFSSKIQYLCKASFGIGPDTAATLLIAAGSNPDRLHSEAAFASLCGVNPIPASSGKTNRHRLNRGGHRQANTALHRIVVVRLRHDLRTQAYMHRRTQEGMSKAELIRCLKRYVARETFSSLRYSVHAAQNTP